ncbi:hypothetical protein Agub_g7309, partial [Astrephomene gubernaculifera]
EPAPARRPQFLGLGAKYLPHHKAVEAATALNTKLRRRLERGMAARRQAEQEEAEEAGTAGKGGKGGPPGRGGQSAPSRSGKGFHGPASGAAATSSGKGLSDSDDEEEERKGAGRQASRATPVG